MARNSSEMARRSSEHGYIKHIDWISNKTYLIMIQSSILHVQRLSMQICLMLKNDLMSEQEVLQLQI